MPRADLTDRQAAVAHSSPAQLDWTKLAAPRCNRGTCRHGGVCRTPQACKLIKSASASKVLQPPRSRRPIVWIGVAFAVGLFGGLLWSIW